MENAHHSVFSPDLCYGVYLVGIVPVSRMLTCLVLLPTKLFRLSTQRIWGNKCQVPIYLNFLVDY